MVRKVTLNLMEKLDRSIKCQKKVKLVILRNRVFYVWKVVSFLISIFLSVVLCKLICFCHKFSGIVVKLKASKTLTCLSQYAIKFQYSMFT